MEWYLKAAERGNSNSQFNIGLFYDEGLGVEQDYVKSFQWYLKASEYGNAEVSVKSIHKIGYFYDAGLGVEQDYVKAMEWYLKAAERGNSRSQFNIGCLYENGLGVEQDYVKSMEWYLKAAEGGNSTSQLNIGYFYDERLGVEQDYNKALEWYLKAAKGGNSTSQFYVSDCYEAGDGVEKDMKEALYWKAKGLNKIDFIFIEPYHEFGIESYKKSYNDLKQAITSENEIIPTKQAIIRFSEKDFKVSNNFSNSKYFSAMLNSNWRDLNEKDGNEIILDLRPIENSIFEDETNHIQIFELYFNYLTRYELPNDCELKLKLIELSRYLGDDECILQIMRDSSLLLRFYILFKFELIEPIHIAIASCYITESSESLPLNIEELSENVLEILLTQSELSELAKKEILKVFEKKFEKITSSMPFSK